MPDKCPWLVPASPTRYRLPTGVPDVFLVKGCVSPTGLCEILDTVLEVMEVDNLLASGATIDIFPNSSNVLVQLGEKTKPADVAETVTAVRVERER